jgi:hypothetical protein
MFCTIINDCRDANAAGRQITRAISFLGYSVSFIGVESDLEAAGNLVDALDAAEGKKGVILVNVAPRNGKAKKWANGAPFGYFWYKKTLVVTSVDGLTLSLAKKLGILRDFRILEIPLQYEKSQFRSFEFLPRIAKDLIEDKPLQYKNFLLKGVAGAPKAVWWIDNFGNCKTALLPEDAGFQIGQLIKTKLGKLPCFEGLKDVPNGKVGFVIGSSGLGGKRFLEIVKQGGSAATSLRISSGCVFIR